MASFISIQNLSFSPPLLGAAEAWEAVRHEVPMVLHRPHDKMVDDGDCDDDGGGDDDDDDDDAEGFTQTSRSNGARWWHDDDGHT